MLKPTRTVLNFMIVWTVLATVLLIAFLRQDYFWNQAPFFRFIFCAMPVVGLWFTWQSLRKYRRWQSLRTEEIDSQTVFAWTDLNGQMKSSTSDPSVEWSKEDRLSEG